MSFTLKCLKITKWKLTDCIYVGDTQGDCNAAKSAGIPFVHAAYGFGSVDNCAAVLQSLDDLPAATARLL